MPRTEVADVGELMEHVHPVEPPVDGSSEERGIREFFMLRLHKEWIRLPYPGVIVQGDPKFMTVHPRRVVRLARGKGLPINSRFVA